MSENEERKKREREKERDEKSMLGNGERGGEQKDGKRKQPQA